MCTKCIMYLLCCSFWNEKECRWDMLPSTRKFLWVALNFFFFGHCNSLFVCLFVLQASFSVIRCMTFSQNLFPHTPPGPYLQMSQLSLIFQKFSTMDPWPRYLTFHFQSNSDRDVLEEMKAAKEEGTLDSILVRYFSLTFMFAFVFVFSIQNARKAVVRRVIF